MIEKIARAICMSAEADNWDELPRNSVFRALYMQQAEDAVRAMREPTDDMADEGYRALHFGADGVWQAMIDSILSQPQEEKVK